MGLRLSSFLNKVLSTLYALINVFFEEEKVERKSLVDLIKGMNNYYLILDNLFEKDYYDYIKKFVKDPLANKGYIDKLIENLGNYIIGKGEVTLISRKIKDEGFVYNSKEVKVNNNQLAFLNYAFVDLKNIKNVSLLKRLNLEEPLMNALSFVDKADSYSIVVFKLNLSDYTKKKGLYFEQDWLTYKGEVIEQPPIFISSGFTST